MLFSACSRIQLFIVLIIGGLTVALGETARPPNAFVYIISPKDGDTVTSPFKVLFGLSGMGVRVQNKSVYRRLSAQQQRSDVLKQRRDWFAGQLDLDPARLVFIDETLAQKAFDRPINAR
jgi:putative transposase